MKNRHQRYGNTQKWHKRLPLVTTNIENEKSPLNLVFLVAASSKGRWFRQLLVSVNFLSLWRQISPQKGGFQQRHCLLLPKLFVTELTAATFVNTKITTKDLLGATFRILMATNFECHHWKSFVFCIVCIVNNNWILFQLRCH